MDDPRGTEESEQLPEENQAELTVEDTASEGDARQEAKESPGAADEDSQGSEATGNPGNAG